MGDLKNKLEDYLSNRSANKLFVLQGILTPDEPMIKNCFNPFSGGPSSLVALASDVTPKVTEWLCGWGEQALNIVIVDWFDKANFVDTILNLNAKKYGIE